MSYLFRSQGQSVINYIDRKMTNDNHIIQSFQDAQLLLSLSDIDLMDAVTIFLIYSFRMNCLFRDNFEFYLQNLVLIFVFKVEMDLNNETTRRTLTWVKQIDIMYYLLNLGSKLHV